MRATELMIGDWVEAEIQVGDTGKKPVYAKLRRKVKSLEKTYIELEDRCEEGATISPIPLTPEILKNNGFENIGSQFLFDSICMIWWKDNIFMFSKYTRHEDLPTENISINIGYVHELQHALRLCGIEKEIEL